MSNTDKGVLTGATLGGVAGGVIGHAAHNTGAGAVIGALAGGIAGGAIGSHVDEKEAQARAQAAAAQRGPLGLEQIADMSRNHIGDSVIVNQIRLSGNVYRLTSDQIVWLKQNGVSDYVVAEMQATDAYRPGRRVYTPAPVVVYEEAPPPPVGVGVGVTFRR
jgi:hypothetical protein